MLDSLLESTKAWSSNEYSQASVKAFLETLTKEHASNLSITNKHIADSTQTCKEMAKKVAKLISDAQTFICNFHTSYESNTAKANPLISSLGTSLQTKKDALEKARIGIQSDNTEFHTSISSKIDKLQADFAHENKIMDERAVKTEQAKVLSVKLTHENS